MNTITPVIHRQLDRCGVCGDAKHKVDLVWTQVDYEAPEGENHFDYSTFDGTYWTSALAAATDNAIGPYADESRMRVNDDNTLTQVGGTPCLVSSGYLGTASSMNISTWTNFCFSCLVGHHHEETEVEMTFVLAMPDAGAPTKTQQFTTKYMKRVYLSGEVAIGTAVDFTVTATVTGNAEWFATDFQLEQDVLVPGEFLPTRGTGITTRVLDRRSMSTVKVCDRCREKVLKRSTAIGRPYKEVEPEVEHDPQEF